MRAGSRGGAGGGARLLGSAGPGASSGMVEGKRPSAGNGGPAMAVAVSLTVTQVREDGSAGSVDDELAAALAGAVEQFSSMLTWTARQAGSLDHGERETVIGDSGRELQRQLLEE